METQPGDVVLLPEEARLVRAAIRMGLEADKVFELLRNDRGIPAAIREQLPKPLDRQTRMMLRLVEDRLPESLRAVE